MGNSCVQFDLFKSRVERQLSIRRPQLWTFCTGACSFSGDWSALLVRAQQSRARHTILAESLQYTQSRDAIQAECIDFHTISSERCTTLFPSKFAH